MKFCQFCQGMMRLENGKFECSCGNFEYARKTHTIERNANPATPVQVLESEINPLAVYDHACSACGFGKAQLVSKGIFVSDEDEMTEFICGKCGHHDPEEGLRA